MKIIVAYASAGAGHTRAAEAIYKYLKGYYPQAEIKIVDVLEKSNRLFRDSYLGGYRFLIRQAIMLWHFAFWITSFKYLRKTSRLIASGLNQFSTLAFASFLERENPDFLISTHFLPSEISAGLKLRGKIKAKIITVITDFGVHPFWISPGTDIYIVASEITKSLLVKEGVLEKKISVLGIPTDEKFLKSYSRQAIAKKIGIAPDKFTVLLMTGSFGIGPLEEIAEALHEEVQLLVVCASNRNLYQNLQKKNLANVKTFGFIQNPEELMAASDLIITKPGGLSISEILCMELPPIFISAIPGQEMENQEILRNYGVGLFLKTIPEIKFTVMDLKNHPEKLNSIRESIRKIKKPHTLEEIRDVVC